MNVLSLFNGMGFGAMALETLGVKVDNYYSSEIDKFANQAANALFPDTIQIGDVTKWREWNIDLGDIDLLIAGFPCQAWSMAGKQEGDDDPRGALVHDLIDIWKSINRSREAYGKIPVKFMFENVRMKKKFLDYINNLFGVEPICINSALVSAQNRVRYYWTNIDGSGQPSDKGIILADILEYGDLEPNSDGWQKWWKTNKDYQIRKKYSAVCNDGSTDKAICMTARQYASWNGNFYKIGSMIGRRINPETGKRDDYNKDIKRAQRLECRGDDKSNCLTTVQKDNLVIVQTPRGNNPGGIRAENGKTPCLSSSSWEHNNHLTDGVKYRKLTVRECSRLQTVPEHKIDAMLESGVTNSQLYKMLGNGWTHDVITHIFRGLTEQVLVFIPDVNTRPFKQMPLW